MRFITAVTTLAAAVTASVIPRDVKGLDIELSAEGNTMIKMLIHNKNDMDIQLLNKGTILDEDHVEKVLVSSEGNSVPFTGMRKRVATTDLPADAFTPLKAGESIEVSIDMAAVHDLSNGGLFKVSTFGALPYSIGNGTELVAENALVYASNELEITVDGAQAAKVPRAYPVIEKRTELQSQTCNANQLRALTGALRYCNQLAGAAATAAQSGSSAKFQEFFKTTSSSTRGNVAARFRAIATECGSTTTGATTYYCQDVYRACSSGVLAYTLPSQDLVVSCPIFFNNLPLITRQCYVSVMRRTVIAPSTDLVCQAQDQSTTVLHEFTHAPGVYAPGTEDNGYGYAASTALSASQVSQAA